MIRLLVATLLVFVLAPPPTSAIPITDPSQLSPHTTPIDFENVDTGGNLVTILPNPVTFGDVTFTSLTGTLSIFDISVAGWPADGTEVASKTLFPDGEPDSAILITFASPVSEFLLGWGGPDFQGNVLRAYNAAGTLNTGCAPGCRTGRACFGGRQRKRGRSSVGYWRDARPSRPTKPSDSTRSVAWPVSAG